MTTVTVELVILSPPRLKRENRAGAVTNSADIGVADSLDVNSVMQGSQSGACFEIVDESFSLPCSNDNALPSLLTGETSRKRGTEAAPNSE